ncbi:hypothetical protein TRFO_22957 [Tritrichomonas foetus]|uniref:DUF3447 domain-containing protein n=1 Tax=Tritrichomonas foetus TaxID=1144522 RepID=A0A1J4KFW3_9EUKA|nr:hypothetical protein TRFO_22957 [Tritrichomonas foetus]|eukprot:OHT08526.1 hypothetical protein TRFO_22957 [Tritrichomonas foetus]
MSNFFTIFRMIFFFYFSILKMSYHKDKMESILLKDKETLQKLLTISKDKIKEINDYIISSTLLNKKKTLISLLRIFNVVVQCRPKSLTFIKTLIESISDKIQLFLKSEELYLIFNHMSIIVFLHDMDLIDFETIYNYSHRSDEVFAFFYYSIKLHDLSYFRTRISLGRSKIMKLISKDRYLPDSYYHFQYCLEGVNHSEIAKIIRDDDILSFQAIISQTNLPLNSEIPFSIYESNDLIKRKANNTQLIEYSAFYGSIHIFKFLIMQMEKLPDNISIFAVAGGCYEIIHILEAHKLLFDEKCVATAVEFHHNDIYDYLLTKYDITKIVSNSFFPSILRYNIDIFLNSINNFDIEERDIEGWNAIHCAAISDRINMIKFLIKFSQNRIDLHSLTPLGNNPFHFALQKGNPDIVEFFIKHCSIDITEVDQFDCMPLFTAVREGHLMITKMLTKMKNCDINHKNYRDETVLILAARHGYFDIVRYLLTLKDIDIHHKNLGKIFT